MKKLTLLLFVTFFTCFLPSELFSQNDTTGWIDKGTYIESRRSVSPFTFIRYSRDGKYLYTFSEDSIFRKWSVATGNIATERKVSKGFNYSFDLSWDETKYCVSDYIDGKESIFYLDNDSIFPLRNHRSYPQPKNTISFWPSSASMFHPFKNEIILMERFFLYTADYQKEEMHNYTDGWFSTYSATSGSLLKVSGQGSGKGSLAFSPDGRWTAYYTYYDTERREKNYHYMYAIERIVIADNNYKEISCIDSSILDMKHENIYNSFNYHLVFSHNSNMVAYYHGGRLAVYKAPGGSFITRINPDNIPVGSVQAFGFSHDNKNIITASVYENKAYLCFWHLPNGRLFTIIELDTNANLSEFSFSKNSNELATAGSDGKIRIFKNTIFEDIVPEIKVDSNIVYIGDSLHFYGNSTGKVTEWNWDFGDSTTSTEQNPVHVFKKQGYFSITLAVGNGFYRDTIFERKLVHVLKRPVSVNENTLESDFDIYPNPFNERLSIRINQAESGNIRFLLYNIKGVKVSEITEAHTEPESKTLELETSSLPPGTYYYKLITTQFEKTGILTKIE